MDKKYWHELSEDEISVLLNTGTTWGEIVEKYKQPDWCTYHQALMGAMGCWSLTAIEIRPKISREFCKNCDCYVNSTEKPCQI